MRHREEQAGIEDNRVTLEKLIKVPAPDLPATELPRYAARHGSFGPIQIVGSPRIEQVYPEYASGPARDRT